MALISRQEFRQAREFPIRADEQQRFGAICRGVAAISHRHTAILENPKLWLHITA
jgi:hypothetical protein